MCIVRIQWETSEITTVIDDIFKYSNIFNIFLGKIHTHRTLCFTIEVPTARAINKIIIVAIAA